MVVFVFAHLIYIWICLLTIYIYIYILYSIFNIGSACMCIYKMLTIDVAC